MNFFSIGKNDTLTQHFRALKRAIRSIYYVAKSQLKPHNIVKISALPSTWVDRDYLMFHANFQILVDFIELEQPYTNHFDYRGGRFTDLGKMREFVNELYGADGKAGFYCDWLTDEDKIKQDEKTEKALRINTELLDLYEWYTTKQYEVIEDGITGDFNELDAKLMQLIKLRRYLWT